MKRAWLLVALSSLVAVGCAQRLSRKVAAPEAVATVDRRAPFLKVHMRDGSLYVLSPWAAEEAERRVTGTGTRYGADRQVLEEGVFSVSLDSVALFETNVAHPSPSVAALAIVIGITVSVAA